MLITPIDKDSDHNTGRVSAARADNFLAVVSSPGFYSSPDRRFLP